jgi:hypothetical protein
MAADAEDAGLQPLTRPAPVMKRFAEALIQSASFGANLTQSIELL